MNNQNVGLADQVDTAQWQWLRAHNERGGLIVVDMVLELAEVGERVAADDQTAVHSWLASHLISKPTAEQIAAWDAMPDKLFSMLVVSPFVLVQEQGAVSATEVPLQ